MVSLRRCLLLMCPRNGKGEAEAQTIGFPRALFKGFDTKTKALLWYQANGGVLSNQEVGDEIVDDPPKPPPDVTPSAVTPPAVTPPDVTPTGVTHPTITFSYHDEPAFLLEDAKTRKQFDIPPFAQIIYTDGACPDNGLATSHAGIGIFHFPNSPHNLSARLPGHTKPTNAQNSTLSSKP